MFQSKTYEISSTDDIELGIRRYSKLEFKVSFDDTKPMKALFVFINGIRDEDYAGYEEHLAEFVVQTYGAAVLRVDYHCIGFRPQTGATFYMDKRDKEIFKAQCSEIAQHCDIELNLPDDLSNDENLGQNESYALLTSLNDIILELKNAHKIPQDYRSPLSISLQPTKNEYQNFGLMQALDIINAIYFVRKNHAKFKLAKTPKTLLFGTSHGGYLALLCAKFAPWLIDAVVENSGYANAPLRFLGFGKEFDYKACFESNTASMFDHLAIFVFTKTFFTSVQSSPKCYTEAHDKIRSLPELDHLQTQAACHKAVFVSYHSARDFDIARPEPKQRLYQMLEKLDFDATLHLIKDESEVDGKFIKNLKHGMDMSLKTLIKKELPPLLARKFTHKKNQKHEIIYKSENLEYKFKEKADSIELVIKKL